MGCKVVLLISARSVMADTTERPKRPKTAAPRNWFDIWNISNALQMRVFAPWSQKNEIGGNYATAPHNKAR